MYTCIFKKQVINKIKLSIYNNKRLMRDFLLCSLKLLQNQKDNPTKGDFLDVIIKVIENIIMTDGALIKNDSTNKQKNGTKKKVKAKPIKISLYSMLKKYLFHTYLK